MKSQFQETIQYFPLRHLSGLREVKNPPKIQTFSSKSGCGRISEVVAHKRFQI